MKEGLGTTVLKIDLVFLIFSKTGKHDSCGTVSLTARENHNNAIIFTIIYCILDQFLLLPHTIKLLGNLKYY